MRNSSSHCDEPTAQHFAAGIFPLTPIDVDARGRWFVGTPATYVPKSLWPIQDLPEGLLSPTYSMMQQGEFPDGLHRIPNF